MYIRSFILSQFIYFLDYFAGIYDAKELNVWSTDTEFELDVMQSQSVDIALVWSSRLIVSDYLVRNKDKINNKFIESYKWTNKPSVILTYYYIKNN